MHNRTIPAGGRLRRAVPNSSPMRKSVREFGAGPGGGAGGGFAGMSDMFAAAIVLGRRCGFRFLQRGRQCFQRIFSHPLALAVTLVTLPRVTVAATMRKNSFGGNRR